MMSENNTDKLAIICEVICGARMTLQGYGIERLWDRTEQSILQYTELHVSLNQPIKFCILLGSHASLT